MKHLTNLLALISAVLFFAAGDALAQGCTGNVCDAQLHYTPSNHAYVTVNPAVETDGQGLSQLKPCDKCDPCSVRITVEYSGPEGAGYAKFDRGDGEGGGAEFGDPYVGPLYNACGQSPTGNTSANFEVSYVQGTTETVVSSGDLFCHCDI